MLNKFRTIDYRWDKANDTMRENIETVSSDERGRKLVVQVLNNGQVEDVTGVGLSLYWETKDKHHDGLDSFDLVDAKVGIFELYFTTGMLSNIGDLDARLHLIDSNAGSEGAITSKPFIIEVRRGINTESVESEDSFSALTEALVRVVAIESQEEERQDNEKKRQKQEEARGRAEDTRQTQEKARERGEADRNTKYGEAETARDNKYKTAEDNRDSLYEEAENNRESQYDTRLGNVEEKTETITGDENGVSFDEEVSIGGVRVDEIQTDLPAGDGTVDYFRYLQTGIYYLGPNTFDGQPVPNGYIHVMLRESGVGINGVLRIYRMSASLTSETFTATFGASTSGSKQIEWEKVFQGTELADYVIEQGENYTKWESGKLEQWGSIDAGVLSLTRPRGNLFISEESLRIDFPYEFIKEPILTLIPDTGAIIGLYIGELFSSGADVWPLSALRHERTVEYSYRAVGRWKE